MRSFLGGVLVVCLLAGLLVGVHAMPNRLARRDTVPSNLTCVSEQTLSFLRGLTEDVRLYWLCEGAATEAQMELFLSRYTEAGDHVTLKVVDPLEDEDFKGGYEDSGLGNYSLFIRGSRRSTIIDSVDLYAYTNDYMNEIYQTTVEMTYDELESFYTQFKSVYGYYPEAESTHVLFCGERLLTRAIDYVTAETIPHGYVLTGHGSDDLPKGLAEVMDSFGFLPDELDLGAADGVPADANCVILYAPRTDLSEREATLLSAYLERGGSLLLVTNPSVLTTCPRVAAIGRFFGLSGMDGVIIDHDDAHMANQSVYQLVPVANQQQSVAYLMSANGVTARFPNTHGISVSATLPAGVTATAMLSTSTSGEQVSLGANPVSLGEKGAIPVAVAATRQITREDGTAGTARMTWFGSSEAFSDEVSGAVSYGNHYYFSFSVMDMSPTFTSTYEDMAAVELRADTMDRLPGGAAVVWTIVIAVVIPVGCLTGGVLVYVRRRRRVR